MAAPTFDALGAASGTRGERLACGSDSLSSIFYAPRSASTLVDVAAKAVFDFTTSVSATLVLRRRLSMRQVYLILLLHESIFLGGEML